MSRWFCFMLIALLPIAGAVSAQETPTCEAGFRLFDHELLATEPVCIPENPQRVAFIDNLIAYGIALDVPSVTRSYYFDAILADFPALLDEAAINAMTDVGNTWEMSAESLLLAGPDLVITSIYWPEANEYAQTIAPTVIIDPDKSTSWLQTFDAITQVFDKADKKAGLLAGIDARLTTLAELVGEDSATTFTVSIVESPEQLWMFTKMNFGAELALKAGMSLTENVMTPEEALESGGGLYAFGVSLEQIPLLEADHIFLFSNSGSTVHEELFASPVWESFVGDAPERIHLLEGDYWVRDHPFAAHRVIDDLFRFVAGVEPEEVSPNPFAYTYEIPVAAPEPTEEAD